MIEDNFINKVLNAFKTINKEIEKGSSEADVRYKFVKYFLEQVLNFDSKDIKWEKERADLTLFDENRFPVIKIETKKPSKRFSASVKNELNIKQAFKYKDDITKFIGITNFLQFRLWEIKDKKRKLRIDLDFDAILKHKRFYAEDLYPKEKSQILFFGNISKEALFNAKKYSQFDETYAKIDITKKQGFNKLLERLSYIAHRLLLGHVLKSFGEYKEGYNEYLEKTKQIDELIERNRNKEFQKNLLIKKQNLEKEFEGKKGATIREFVTSEKYAGFTKNGTRIPIDKWSEFKELVNKVGLNKT